MTTLFLVRHGETDWNAEGRWQGHADVPLNDTGRAQAQALADELAADTAFDAIYASDLARARETAEIVAQRLGVELVLERDLREIDVGSRQGHTWSEIDDTPPWDGEMHDAHGERILGVLRRIARGHPGGRILVVTHGGSMRRVHEHLDLEAPPIDNCTVWSCVIEDGVLRAIA
jgi:probable phosphoglycerate mutase